MIAIANKDGIEHRIRLEATYEDVTRDLNGAIAHKMAIVSGAELWANVFDRVHRHVHYTKWYVFAVAGEKIRITTEGTDASACSRFESKTGAAMFCRCIAQVSPVVSYVRRGVNVLSQAWLSQWVIFQRLLNESKELTALVASLSLDDCRQFAEAVQGGDWLNLRGVDHESLAVLNDKLTEQGSKYQMCFSDVDNGRWWNGRAKKVTK